MSGTLKIAGTTLAKNPTNSPNVALDKQSNLINVTWPEVPE